MFTHVYAMFTQCLRIVYALQPMSAKTEKLSVNRVNISRHCMFTQVFAYQQCLRSYIFANHAVFPHLRRSSRGSEAATCPESSPGCAQQLRVRTDGNGEEALPGPGQLQVRAANIAAVARELHATMGRLPSVRSAPPHRTARA